MSTATQKIKNGLLALQPVSIGLVAVGGILLINQGASLNWQNMTYLRAAGFGLVGLGSLAYMGDYGAVAFL